MSANPIDLIAERLDGGRLWLKGDLGDTENPKARVCLRGAGLSCQQDQVDGGVSASSLVICEVIPGAGQIQWDFNDHPDTTWEDMALVLKDASARWDESR